MCHVIVVSCSFKKLKKLSVIKIETPDREDSSSINYAVFCIFTHLIVDLLTSHWNALFYKPEFGLLAIIF